MANLLLVHQKFHLKYLSLDLKIDWCVNKMRDYLKEVPQGGLYPILLNSKHSLEHQVAHFINEEQENTRVIYRFMGIDNRIVNEIQNKDDEQREYMLLGLRKIKGINIQEFKNKFIE